MNEGHVHHRGTFGVEEKLEAPMEVCISQAIAGASFSPALLDRTSSRIMDSCAVMRDRALDPGRRLVRCVCKNGSTWAHTCSHLQHSTCSQPKRPGIPTFTGDFTVICCIMHAPKSKSWTCPDIGHAVPDFDTSGSTPHPQAVCTPRGMQTKQVRGAAQHIQFVYTFTGTERSCRRYLGKNVLSM